MLKKYKKKILLGLLVVFGLIQFKTIDKSSPEAVMENDFLVLTHAPSEVVGLMKEVCYDCHSHSPVYPWYSNIAPVSWWIKGHMDHGIEKANYSDWNNYSAIEKDSILVRSSRLVEKKWMPILTYKITHADARLSLEQRNMLIEFFEEQREE